MGRDPTTSPSYEPLRLSEAGGGTLAGHGVPRLLGCSSETGQGHDILAHTDPLGTNVPRIKVQVKRHEGKISVAGLRSFLAVLGEHDVGLFVCTGGFTGDAEEGARTQETRKVMLLGLEQLFDIWVQYYGKSAEEDKKLLPLRPVYYLAPVE